jgi:hypothetical protein
MIIIKVLCGCLAYCGFITLLTCAEYSSPRSAHPNQYGRSEYSDDVEAKAYEQAQRERAIRRAQAMREQAKRAFDDNALPERVPQQVGRYREAEDDYRPAYRRDNDSMQQRATPKDERQEFERYRRERNIRRKRQESYQDNEHHEEANETERQEEPSKKEPEKKEGFMDKVEKLNLEENADKLLGAAATANKFLSMFSKLGGQ